MRPHAPLLLLALAALASCSQPAANTFSPAGTPRPTGPASPPQLDLAALSALRGSLRGALDAHLHDGRLDVAWGSGASVNPAGPYTGAAAETDAAALQAMRPGADSGSVAPVADATVQDFRQLDGPRGGAYLLLSDAAHPAPPAPPSGVDTPLVCPTPLAGGGRPDCLRKQVSDGLLAAWYARDSKMFFKVGETATVYRPVDAITVGAALVVAGFQLRDDAKIEAGDQVIAREMKNDLDDHYGMLFGLVTATSEGGHSVTDYHTSLADQAGAAEALLEAFDYSREAQHQADAQKLLTPLLEERFATHGASGGYVMGFDLQASGPAEGAPTDPLAAVLTLQAARHYDRDDGGRLAHLEETAAAALLASVAADRKAGGDPLTGVPAQEGPGPVQRSGLATALAVTVLADVLRDLATPSPTPSG